MGSKSSYKTKQGDELRSFLESVPGKHITAADVIDSPFPYNAHPYQKPPKSAHTIASFYEMGNTYYFEPARA